MQLFKIKWEIVITLMLIATTIYTWILYFAYGTEERILLAAILATFGLIVMAICYKGIKTFRKEALKLWK